MTKPLTLLLLFLGLMPLRFAQATPEAILPEKHFSLLEKNCLDCHDAATEKGKVNLEDLPFEIATIEQAELWQKVLNSMNSGEMPPEDKPQPDGAVKADFLEDLSRTMVEARRILSDSGGKITMRRLNRREYKNTIRDLLGVEIDVRDLPSDVGAGTFDTVGSSLFMSSDQIEQYLILGRKAIDEAFARQISSETNEVTQTWKQRREVEEHANAKVGGTYNGYFKGGNDAAKAMLETGKAQKGIADEQEARFRIRAFAENGPSFRRYLEHPLTQTGAFLTIANVNKEEIIDLPPEQPSGWRKTKHVVETLPPGDYVLRFRIGAVAGTEKERHFVELGSRLGAEQAEFALMDTFQVSGSTDTPQIIEVPVSLSADGPRKFVLREKRDTQLDNERYKAARKETGMGPMPALWIDWVEWEGPIHHEAGSSTVEPILFSHTTGASEKEHAHAVLKRFATRAFRGAKPDADYLEKLSAIYQSRRKAGDSFEVALRDPLSAILASPGFLYLSEPGEEGQPRDLTGQELATRLSYFLWSAPPDRELLDLAESGELLKPDALAKQVDRLLADERSREFVTGFVHQWLGMDRLDFFQFDTKLHHDFDESAKAAARSEVYESFALLLRDNGSLGCLLKSDYVVINGLLATYYGLDGVSGDEFRKVSLPADSPRGGLLGMAAILAMGSNGVETSPVERGAWVLRKLLHDPPPPAPKNVPQISRLAGEILTTRERFAAHMEEAQCAQCHRKIDPIGFGLENFNAAGKWRTTDHYEKKGVGKKEWEIDPAGAFHNGPAFEDFFELRDLVAARQEDFAQGMTESLIEYALGRPYGFTDADLADEVVAHAGAKDFAVREFILALVESRTFRRK
ncbi:MAG: DUF1592 domain-containing protein [Verrucomicrobiae bacterium]|nr:DUF1592 domain-containing protein [Verrucomicrobiae bacterium]